jgi:hypothetical protein
MVNLSIAEDSCDYVDYEISRDPTRQERINQVLRTHAWFADRATTAAHTHTAAAEKAIADNRQYSHLVVDCGWTNAQAFAAISGPMDLAAAELFAQTPAAIYEDAGDRVFQMVRTFTLELRRRAE